MISGLTSRSEMLYEIGMKRLSELHCDNAAERRKLLTACKDVDKLETLCAENEELYASTLSTVYPSPNWTRLLKINKQVTMLTLRLIANARAYGWTPMSRSVHHRRMALQAHVGTETHDRMEEILVADDRNMRQPELKDDPMEEVLSRSEQASEGK